MHGKKKTDLDVNDCWETWRLLPFLKLNLVKRTCLLWLELYDYEAVSWSCPISS